MALFQASITIWLLFILINGGLLLVANYGLALCAEQPHISCGWANDMVANGINSTNFNQNSNIQNYTSPTGTLVGNLTNPSNITFGNHTGNNDVLDPIYDSSDGLLFNTQELGRYVTGICTICNTVDALVVTMNLDPDGVVFSGMTALIVAGIGVTNVLLLIYLSSGRSI